VALYDIESFVGFNEHWGHIGGDCLIAALAKQIQGMLPAADFVARYAGNEFAVIVHRSSPQKVGEVADILRETIAGAKFRLEHLLRPNARHSAPDQPLSLSAANEYYQRGLQHLRANELAEAAQAFKGALEQDAKHVPSIMELEYLKLRQILDPTRLAEPFRITVSGGVVWYPEENTAESLLERADQCLGLAKHNGRNEIRQEA
jgi:PleD family two-component response regulator